MERGVGGWRVLEGMLFVRERVEMLRGSVEGWSLGASKASLGRACPVMVVAQV